MLSEFALGLAKNLLLQATKTEPPFTYEQFKGLPKDYSLKMFHTQGRKEGQLCASTMKSKLSYQGINSAMEGGRKQFLFFLINQGRTLECE